MKLHVHIIRVEYQGGRKKNEEVSKRTVPVFAGQRAARSKRNNHDVI